MSINIEIAEHHLNAWLAADLAVSNSQIYSIGSRQLTRANAQEIRTNIKYWGDIVNSLKSGSGIRYKTAVPK